MSNPFAYLAVLFYVAVIINFDQKQPTVRCPRIPVADAAKLNVSIERDLRGFGLIEVGEAFKFSKDYSSAGYNI